MGKEGRACGAKGGRGGRPHAARHPRPVGGPRARAGGLPTAPAVRGRVCAHSVLMNMRPERFARGLDMTTLTRRAVLKGSATTALVVGVPGMLSAQAKAPINIGTLCPLTGAGGSYGPDMQRAA